jgi:hypothetical protein
MDEMDDATELTRLRARVAELEAELEERPASDRGGVGSRVRSVSAAVLIVLACVLAPLSVVSVWASTVVSDTDRYVEMVAPVIDDPGVQAALADEVTDAIMTNLDVEGLTTQALDQLAQQENMPPRVAAALPALAVPLTGGIESFTRRETADLLASPQASQVWNEANRVAHDQVVTLLEGNEGGAISAQDDTITLNLGPIIATVKERLVDRGFGLAARIPEVDRSFVLVESEGITRAQTFYSALNALGTWLPILTLALFVGGVYLARGRRGALLRGSLGVAAAMVALGVVLAVVRIAYVETTPAGVLTPETAGNVFDMLVRFLRTGIRTVAVLALIVALAAFVTGPSSAARSARAGTGRLIASARGGADAAGWSTGRFGTWIHAHKTMLRGLIVLAGGVGLVFWSRPTAWVVVAFAVLVVLGLLLLELLDRPPSAVPAGPTAPMVPTGPAAPLDGTGAPERAGTGPDITRTG